MAGSRSVDYSDPGTLSASDAARAIRESGFEGCWVFALAINDAGFVASDPNDSAARRIGDLLEIADGDPVMWVNGSMLEAGTLGHLQPAVMDWNDALLEACEAYPGMKVYDWDREVNPEWFTDDGVHYTPIGYGHRSRLVSSALIEAFPGDQPLPGSPAATGEEAAPTGETTSSEPADCLVGSSGGDAL